MVNLPVEEFTIAIVGAGIGGLACAIALRGEGRKITILEKSRLLRETGAGISLQPNASRIVNKWGIAEDLAKHGSFADKGVRFAIYSTEGKQVMKLPFKEEPDGAARVIYHRIDLHNGLKDLATGSDGKLAGPPAKLRTGTAVEECDCENGTLKLSDGSEMQADLIIGADGIKSIMRNIVTEQTIEAKPTGLSAYRVMLDKKDIENIPELQQIMDFENPYTTIIVGHDRRILMGPARNGEVLTLVALVPDEFMNEDSSTTSWTSEGSLEDVLKSYDVFPEWCKELFRRAPGIGLWQLRDIDPLPTWVKGQTMLIGDAAHAMLPLQGQGASQTFEDVEALKAVFADVQGRPSKEEVRKRLQRAFRGRYDRASLVQGYSRAAAPKAQDTNAEGKPQLNPMEFMEYNLKYYGLEAWLKSHPEYTQV